MKRLIQKDFIDYMKKLIPNLKEVSGGSEILCRCRYCDDSKDMSKAHMYIKVPQSEDDISYYHCFKCNNSGVLNSRKLMEWGIYDPIIGSELDTLYQTAYNNGKLFAKENIIRYNFQNVCMDLKLGYEKLDYINNRLGTKLTIDDCLDSKILLNLKDGISYNKTPLTRDRYLIEQLNQNFVGFISHDNNFVNLRRLVDEGIVAKSIDLRYVNYNIHNNKGNTEKFYMLPFNGYNVNDPYIINVHIAEGPFDILSIRYNLNPFNTKDIFIAIGGSGYLSTVKHLIYEFKLARFNLHLYPDNDNIGTDENMMSIAEYLRPFVTIDVYIHRNMSPGQKDYGVRFDKIQDHILRI